MNNLVLAGMSVDLVETCARDYLNKVAQKSNVYTLMEFFSEKNAKKALHDPQVDLRDVCFNF